MSTMRTSPWLETSVDVSWSERYTRIARQCSTTDTMNLIAILLGPSAIRRGLESVCARASKGRENDGPTGHAGLPGLVQCISPTTRTFRCVQKTPVRNSSGCSPHTPQPPRLCTRGSSVRSFSARCSRGYIRASGLTKKRVEHGQWDVRAAGGRTLRGAQPAWAVFWPKKQPGFFMHSVLVHYAGAAWDREDLWICCATERPIHVRLAERRDQRTASSSVLRSTRRAPRFEA